MNPDQKDKITAAAIEWHEAQREWIAEIRADKHHSTEKAMRLISAEDALHKAIEEAEE